MKNFLQLCFVIFLLLSTKKIFSQNVMLNVLTQNSGIVKQGDSIFFEITISNTSNTKSIPPYKLKPQISFPVSIVEIPKKGHVLPKGWGILSNKDGVVMITNGSDVIPENESRTILIALKGKTVGGPSTITGTVFFSNSIAPGSNAGSPLEADISADNYSTSTIMVVK